MVPTALIGMAVAENVPAFTEKFLFYMIFAPACAAMLNKIMYMTSKMCEIADALERIGYEKGVDAGEYKKLVLQTCRKLQKGYPIAEIAEMLEEEVDVINKICEVASSYAPNYDAEMIFDTLTKE